MESMDLHVVDLAILDDITPTAEQVLTAAFMEDLGMRYISGEGASHPEFVKWVIRFSAHIAKKHARILGVVGTPRHRRTEFVGDVVAEDIAGEDDNDDYLRPIPTAGGKPGTVEIVEEPIENELLGAAIIFPPGASTSRDMVKDAMGAVGGTPLRDAKLFDESALSRSRAWNGTADQAHEDAIEQTPHYYLQFIGVRPDCQGEGIGGMLLAHLCSLAEQASVPIYLDTSGEENPPMYQHFGFESVGKYVVDAGTGASLDPFDLNGGLWAMVRKGTHRKSRL